VSGHRTSRAVDPHNCPRSLLRNKFAQTFKYRAAPDTNAVRRMNTFVSCAAARSFENRFAQPCCATQEFFGRRKQMKATTIRRGDRPRANGHDLGRRQQRQRLPDGRRLRALDRPSQVSHAPFRHVGLTRGNWRGRANELTHRKTQNSLCVDTNCSGQGGPVTPPPLEDPQC